MVDRSDFDELLGAMRFDDASELVDQAAPEAQEELRNRLAQRRTDAEKRAQELFEKINQPRDESQNAEVVEIARDPLTPSLLSLLPDTPRRHAQMRLDEAELWAANRRKANERRLKEAQRALDGLDLELARGLMKRIDGRFLSSEQEDARDQLLLDISARGLEMESLEKVGENLVEDGEDDKPWWRRRRS